MMESAGTKPHVQSAAAARSVIGLLVPGTDSFAIDVSLGATRGRTQRVAGATNALTWSGSKHWR
jgi:hypothetical protein